MSLLLAYVIHYGINHFTRKQVAYGLIGVLYITLGYGALARPAMLSHMNTVAGFAPYPDAMAELKRATGLGKVKSVKAGRIRNNPAPKVLLDQSAP
jgi:hypothetical protein